MPPPSHLEENDSLLQSSMHLEKVDFTISLSLVDANAQGSMSLVAASTLSHSTVHTASAPSFYQQSLRQHYPVCSK